MEFNFMNKVIASLLIFILVVGCASSGNVSLDEATEDNVAQAIIEELEKIDSLAPKPYYKIGQKLRIRSGALKGLKAIYDAPDGTSRSYLLLTFMQQNQRVSIDNQRLKKL